MNKEKNRRLADCIKEFLERYSLNIDTRIYFNNMCYSFDSSGNMTVIKNIKASDYFEYANDDTVSMTFEGPLYNALNHGHWTSCVIVEEFAKIFENHGMHYEMGNMWNLAAYY